MQEFQYLFAMALASAERGIRLSQFQFAALC
ncbi:Uncharacterised protein [Mycobacteroides abscessus subsp. massiliense]|nr:Uncharacterised protein [Mycobacteroides abscessus subsp. massiliense]SKH00379.1 Uncharacterised protein [Mycobacteroides abscessus subsp. massiliense]SKI01239.1 Uncharacterised protein [Mycobacteroides abscessus subsp. massiliense]SKJ05731.1 Uncharacterised protein [Mycobacteroides abscessus subsp. massiliense]SKJ08521.1 Uncharacterised protein [Mycobacteroides abscessus subsp. massiliense]